MLNHLDRDDSGLTSAVCGPHGRGGTAVSTPLVIAGSAGVDRLGAVDGDAGLGVLLKVLRQALARQISLVPEGLQRSRSVANHDSASLGDREIFGELLTIRAGGVHLHADVLVSQELGNVAIRAGGAGHFAPSI